MDRNRTLFSLAIGFALGCLLTAACSSGGGSAAIASILGNAIDVLYTNTTSGLAATTVQGAIDETNGKIGTLSQLNTTNKTSMVAAVNEVKAAATQPFYQTVEGINAGQSAFRWAGMTAGNGTREDVEGAMLRVGTLTNLVVRARQTTPASANVVTTVLVNGVATGLSVTFAGSAAAGSATSNTAVNVVPGDLVVVRFENTGSAFAPGTYLAAVELR